MTRFPLGTIIDTIVGFIFRFFEHKPDEAGEETHNDITRHRTTVQRGDETFHI